MQTGDTRSLVNTRLESGNPELIRVIRGTRVTTAVRMRRLYIDFSVINVWKMLRNNRNNSKSLSTRSDRVGENLLGTDSGVDSYRYGIHSHRQPLSPDPDCTVI